MKVTAVILHYWAKRRQNIVKIIHGLKTGSYKPDKIILFNNNKDVYLPEMDGVSVINSDTNFGGRARYPVGLLEPSDYYFFDDDDMAVNKNTLKNFVNHAEPGCCLGYRGKVINPDVREMYNDSQTFWGNKVTESVDVDLLIGAGGFFVSYSALANMLETEIPLIREGYEFGREEDIILSMSNDPKVIPAKEDEYLDDLPAFKEGYCEAPNHRRLRNEMVERLYHR